MVLSIKIHLRQGGQVWGRLCLHLPSHSVNSGFGLLLSADSTSLEGLNGLSTQPTPSRQSTEPSLPAPSPLSLRGFVSLSAVPKRHPEHLCLRRLPSLISPSPSHEEWALFSSPWWHAPLRVSALEAGRSTRSVSYPSGMLCLFFPLFFPPS